MFNEAIKKACSNARAKADMAKNSAVKYFILSIMAGFYIGIAILLIYSIGAPLNAAGSPVTKLVMGLTFSIGLTMVVFAGSELFTGNILFTGIGLARKSVTPIDVLRVLSLSFSGNLVGSLLFAFLIKSTGLLSGVTSEYIVAAAAGKANLGIVELIARGVLCNMLVCLALWMGVRASEEVSKLIFIALCLFAFITSGYVHCVADMSHLAMALLSVGGEAVGIAGFVYTIFFGAVGNIIGGVLIAAIYTFAGESR